MIPQTPHCRTLGQLGFLLKSTYSDRQDGTNIPKQLILRCGVSERGQRQVMESGAAVTERLGLGIKATGLALDFGLFNPSVAAITKPSMDPILE